MRKIYPLLGLAALLSGACSNDENTQDPPAAPSYKIESRQLSRIPFYHPQNPDRRTPEVQVSSEVQKLEFFGWSEENDKRFTLQLPEQTAGYDRVMLEYTMGGWNEGPADYDNTTMLFVTGKSDGERYEIVRAFTPFGGSFDGSWTRTYYIDVTEFLPLLSGETEFSLYYGGFDATAKRAHTVQIKLNYYAGERDKEVILVQKLYDSSRDSNTGYRSWAYGLPEHEIEAEERLGLRTVTLPEEVKSLMMRVAISGHGHDQGVFLDRTNYRTHNAAEFDENYYTLLLDGTPQREKGHIFYSNKETYPQAGTYIYDRANWGPGLPLNTHYWEIELKNGHRGELTIDLDLERFLSAETAPNGEATAKYVVEVILFGYDK